MQDRIRHLVSGGTAQMRQCRLNPLSVTIFCFNAEAVFRSQYLSTAQQHR